jgi:hypothetical protein
MYMSHIGQLIMGHGTQWNMTLPIATAIMRRLMYQLGKKAQMEFMPCVIWFV